MTQKKLAKLVGVSQAHIAKIEQGKVDPRLSTINRILKVLTAGKRKCGDIMTRGVFSAKPDDTILEVSELMMRRAISQVPVLAGNRIVGTITEETIIRNLRANLAKEKAKKVMSGPLPAVQEETSIDVIRPMLEECPGVLVARKNQIIGIITRSDLLKTVGQSL